MSGETPEPESTRLLVVGMCPVDSGPIVLLRSRVQPGFPVVGFGPCCGLAWRSPAESLWVHKIDSLAELGSSQVEVADQVDLDRSLWRGIPTTADPVDDFSDDIPGLERRS